MKKWKNNQRLPDASDIKLPARAHVPLVRCRVHLLGRAAPIDTPDGLLAMQKPLHELYASYTPVVSVLTAYTSGLVLRTPADVKPENTEELWFPIQDLMECGAMRGIGGRPPTGFAPLTTVEARTSKMPPLFVFVFKRKDIPVSDCWAVECQSDDAALALMTACKLAHKNPAGWASAVDRPPPVTMNCRVAESQSSEEWDGAAAKEAAVWSNNYPRDYYEKPPLQGFYYTPSTGLIRRYAISELRLQDDEDDGMPNMFPNGEPPMPMNGEPVMNGELALSEVDDASLIEAETATIVRGHRPYGTPADPYFRHHMGTTSSRGAAVVYPEEQDFYGFPPGMLGGPIPESVIYRAEKHDSTSDSDSDHGKKKHKKKKSKKSKKHAKKAASDRLSEYNYYTPDGIRIVPEEAVFFHGAPPSSVSEGPFESHLPPQPGAEAGYDPAYQYGLKSYVRDQQYVSGYTGPQRPYETHIDAFPPADYHVHGPYDDDGPYERRLPVASGRTSKHDPQMLNKNFIIRQKDGSQRRL